MRSAAFWDITPSNHPAFITHDGQVILYSQLKQDIDAFRERLPSARGLISILCDGSYRQYVAYLSALQQKCPVILVAAESNSLSSFSVRYTYDAANDQLNIDDSVTEVPLHPELALLLSTSGSTGAAKSVKLSYGNLEANAQAIAEYLELDNSEKAPMALPFYYSYGLSIYFCFSLGFQPLATPRKALLPVKTKKWQNKTRRTAHVCSVFAL